MLPVLVVSSQGEVRIGQVVDELANQLELSQEDRSDLLPSGKQTVFSNRVPWAKSYLSKAQLVEMTGRGYFRITPRGQAVLRSSPKRMDNKVLMQLIFRVGSKPERRVRRHDSIAAISATRGNTRGGSDLRRCGHLL
jgi:restriction endonuclease Mrr